MHSISVRLLVILMMGALHSEVELQNSEESFPPPNSGLKRFGEGNAKDHIRATSTQGEPLV